jgi:hypothetical protein
MKKTKDPGRRAGFELRFIQPGKTVQRAHICSMDDSFRDI